MMEMEIEVKAETADSSISLSPKKLTNTELVDFEISEILSKDIKENHYNFIPKEETKNEITTSFDAFSDENNQIYRKYNLRKPVQPKKPLVVQSETADVSEEVYKSSSKQKIKKKKTLNDLKEYQCTLCQAVFEYRTGLTVHMLKHIPENKFTCILCQETFEYNDELVKHKLCHRSDEECYICKICELAFSKHDVFIRHSFNHMKPPYQCPECLVTSDYRRTIQNHIHSHFSPKEPCKVCQRLVSKKAMTSHLGSHKSIKCEECGKICSNKPYYNYHMCSHTGVKPYQCLYCGRGFSNQSQKTNHTRLHTGVKLFECRICFHSFTQKSTRDKHEKTHNKGKLFECNICKKKLKNKEYLKYHMRFHNNYKPYKCPDCPQTFVTSTHLTMHTQSMHMKAVFSCELCNMKFHYKRSLHRHNLSKRHQNKAFKSQVNSNQENND